MAFEALLSISIRRKAGFAGLGTSLFFCLDAFCKCFYQYDTVFIVTNC